MKSYGANIREEFYENYAQMLFQINLKHDMIGHIQSESTKNEFRNPKDQEMVFMKYKQTAYLSDFTKLIKPLYRTVRRQSKHSSFFKSMMQKVAPKEILTRLRNKIFIELSVAEQTRQFNIGVESTENAFETDTSPQLNLMKALEGFELANVPSASNFDDNPNEKKDES